MRLPADVFDLRTITPGLVGGAAPRAGRRSPRSARSASDTRSPVYRRSQTSARSCLVHARLQHGGVLLPGEIPLELLHLRGRLSASASGLPRSSRTARHRRRDSSTPSGDCAASRRTCRRTGRGTPARARRPSASRSAGHRTPHERLEGAPRTSRESLPNAASEPGVVGVDRLSHRDRRRLHAWYKRITQGINSKHHMYSSLLRFIEQRFPKPRAQVRFLRGHNPRAALGKRVCGTPRLATAVVLGTPSTNRLPTELEAFGRLIQGEER